MTLMSELWYSRGQSNNPSQSGGAEREKDWVIAAKTHSNICKVEKAGTAVFRCSPPPPPFSPLFGYLLTTNQLFSIILGRVKANTCSRESAIRPLPRTRKLTARLTTKAERFTDDSRKMYVLLSCFKLKTDVAHLFRVKSLTHKLTISVEALKAIL